MSQSHFETPAGSDYLDGIVKGLHYEISLCQSDFGSEEFHLAYFTLYIWKDLEKKSVKLAGKELLVAIIIMISAI